MRFRRIQLIPALFIMTATALLIGLGIWQLQRLEWKNTMVARTAEAQALPVLGDLPDLPDQQAIDAMAFRNVKLTGKFLHDKSLHLVGRSKNAGSENGFFIVTPFILDDDGRTILVNRGFSPAGKEAKPEGTQVISGVIRPARVKRYFSPENHPDKNVWFYEDIPAMSLALGIQLTPVIVEVVGAYQKDVYPIPHNGQVQMRNDHLQYAITWFSLAIIGLIMFIIYHREPSADTKSQAKP
jgi:surfeit locus 1 family protein